MAYTILNTDGTILVTLADKTIDKLSTSLTLIGKNYSGYGEIYNNNLIKLLANNASSTNNPPQNPLTGQLWYDTTAQRLKVYDGSFKPVAGAITADQEPDNLNSGDLWWDTTDEQLKTYYDGVVYLVGPAFPAEVGENGWVLPSTVINDIDDDPKDVTLIKNYDNVIGYITHQSFNVSDSSAYNYITDHTTQTVAGLNILGNIQISGSVQFGLDVTVPTASNSTGKKGTMVWDGGFLYVCTATNSWRKINLGAHTW